MTDDDHTTHAALAAELADSIKRLRLDVASRSDPILEEIAHALELTTHAHDHSLDNRERLRALESGG